MQDLVHPAAELCQTVYKQIRCVRTLVSVGVCVLVFIANRGRLFGLNPWSSRRDQKDGSSTLSCRTRLRDGTN